MKASSSSKRAYQGKNPKEAQGLCLLDILGNDTRRAILQKLSVEEKHIYQLAKELKLTEQRVKSQLDKLLEAGNLVVKRERFRKQKAGTKTKQKRSYYSLNRYVNLKIQFGPGFFDINAEDLSVEEAFTGERDRKEFFVQFRSVLDQLERLRHELMETLNGRATGSDVLERIHDSLNSFNQIESLLLIERQIILLQVYKEIFQQIPGDESKIKRQIVYQLLSQPKFYAETIESKFDIPREQIEKQYYELLLSIQTGDWKLLRTLGRRFLLPVVQNSHEE